MSFDLQGYIDGLAKTAQADGANAVTDWAKTLINNTTTALGNSLDTAETDNSFWGALKGAFTKGAANSNLGLAAQTQAFFSEPWIKYVAIAIGFFILIKVIKK